jgi:hypothetical protein
VSSARDFALVAQLHAWRNQVVRFNAGLAVAEILAFTVESESVLRDLREGLPAEDGPDQAASGDRGPAGPAAGRPLA